MQPCFGSFNSHRLLFIHFGSETARHKGDGERERWLVVRMTSFFFLLLVIFLLLFYLFSAAPISPLFLRPLIGINNAFLAWMSDEMDCPSCCTPRGGNRVVKIQPNINKPASNLKGRTKRDTTTTTYTQTPKQATNRKETQTWMEEHPLSPSLHSTGKRKEKKIQAV